MTYRRANVVNLARTWIGLNEADGSYRKIIDIYNSQQGPFPRGTKMMLQWPWCACTWSALAISLGYTKIMPIEISCGELVNRAKDLGVWIENDGYVPKPGDAILYNWADNGVGDNVGWPDHVGVVEEVNKSSGYMTIIEGNYKDAVGRRTIAINGRYIRGFIAPKYDDDAVGKPDNFGKKKSDNIIVAEVIAGKWGSGSERKKRLTSAGYDYSRIQSLVNKKLNGEADKVKKVTASCKAKCLNTNNYANQYRTTANLYCRDDAGTNKKALCLIPKDHPVRCHGYYNEFNNSIWLLVQFMLNGIEYTGFCSKEYLKEI